MASRTKANESIPRGLNRAEHTNAFVPTRRAGYYIRMGYLAGRGHSSPRIADELADGIHPSYVRTALRRAGIPQPEAFCQVPLTAMQRCWLEYRAEKEGVSSDEYLRRMVAENLMSS